MLSHNPGVTFPKEGLYVIRFHSFYPWHKHGGYQWMMDDFDRKMLPIVQKFQKFDLYTKHDEVLDAEKLKPYYTSLLNKYFPAKLKW